MCRHLAYVGPPVRLSELLFDPPHGLSHQAWAPRDMRGGGTINADGFGVGWFPPPPGNGPVRIRRDRPIWTDSDLPGLTAATTAPAVLAAVRSATPGMPLGEAACAPFGSEGYLFSLNGRIAGWPESVAGLTGSLAPAELLTMAAPTDTALLWAVVRRRLRAGAEPAEAISSTVAEVATAAPGSRLNLLLTDGSVIVATTLTHSLWVRSGGGAVLVSSEPLDDHPAWRPVPDGSRLVATTSGVDISPLPEKGVPS